ncbi:MAG: hypothetical protein KatS3mg085_539 [Candidatus Dojkabacteria bacterium]|nr:MAG: hypothetical protein KatS3mg085_539 [Candidatus Dojkabacteria bacterium]
MKLIKKLHPATYFFVFIIISILFYLFSNFGGAQAGIYSWIQNAWDGGISSSVITSNTNTLSEINNVTTSANKIEIQMTDPNWFDTNWKYRQVITINNPNSSTLTDFQVKIPVDTSALIASGKLQLNCADVRFTNQSGNTLSYWISEGFNECNSASTDFWVKVDNLNIGDNTIYMYYGNPSALPASDGNATFLFFDDFNAISLDLSKWDSLIVGSPSGGNWLVEDGYLKAGNNNRYLLSKTLLNGTYVVESKIYVNSLPANGFTPIGAHSNTNIQASMLFHGAGNRVYLRRNNRWILTISGLNQTGYWAISSVFVNSSNSKQQIFDIANNNIIYNYDFTLGTLLNAKVLLGARGDLYSYNQAYSASWDWVRARKIATTDVSVTINSEEKVYQLNSYATSNIFNTTFPTEWNEISFIASGTFTIKARSDFVSNMSNAQPWSSCDAVTNGLDISSNNCVNNGDQYIQFRVEFDPNGVEFGEVYEIEISYQEYDLDNPVSNASNVLLTGVTAGSWINFKPTVTWDSATDNPGGSGIYGYCIALDETDGTSSNLDPAITGGLLQSLDDGVPKAFCPFIAQGNSLDLNSIAGLNLTSGKTYFISIKAVDNGGNIFSGASIDYQDLTNFKFDNTPPDNPAFINLPVNFVSTKDITISWPVGANGASDSFSGVAGLQYRIGQTGTWYGDLHNGSEGLTDLLADDGVYTTDPTYDYPNLNEGVNKIYFRTLDNAGNVSSSLLQGDIKINTSAPSEVQNLSVTPASNNVNEYQFSWDPPATFTGLVSGLTYCYSVNTLPSSSSCNFTLPGETSIGPGAYATQPGTNTMYIVARDEASNINYATYQSITFEYTGDAPGIPTNLDIADISIKSTSNWRLALSWDVPNDVGAGIANYRIFRSTNTEISCSSNFGSFAQIGSSTSTSYIDTGLSQVTYNYCIVACDSANNCSAPTGNVDKNTNRKIH